MTIYQIGSIVSFLYWGVAALALGAVLWKVRPTRRKIIWACVVAVAFGILPGTAYFEASRGAEFRKAASARYQQLCKEKAGEKIYKVIDNVDGVYLMRPRQVAGKELYDQFWMGDPYGYSALEAEVPGGTLTADRSGKTISGEKLTPITGYQYVEMPNSGVASDPLAPKYVREERKPGGTEGEILRVLSNERLSRYGLDWQDVSTPEDRRYWIAGGRMRVIDLATNEVIAERVGFVVDPGKGSDSGGRTPWQISQHYACPPFEHDLHKAKEFLAKVLKSSRKSVYAS